MMHSIPLKKIIIIILTAFVGNVLPAIQQQPEPALLINGIRNETPFKIIALQEQKFYEVTIPAKTAKNPNPDPIYTPVSVPGAKMHTIKGGTPTTDVLYNEKIHLFSDNKQQDLLLLWHEKQPKDAKPFKTIRPGIKRGMLSLKIIEKLGSTQANPQIDVAEIWASPSEIEQTTGEREEPEIFYTKNIVNRSSKTIKVIKTPLGSDKILESHIIGPKNLRPMRLSNKEKDMFKLWQHQLKFYSDKDALAPFYVHRPSDQEGNIDFIVSEKNGKLAVEPKNLSPEELIKFKDYFKKGKNP